MTDRWPVVYRRKVRFSDTDAQGIVFNANYLRYWDDAFTDLFDILDLPWSSFVERGYDVVLAHVEIDYRTPGRLGDVLCTGVEVASFGRTSLVLRFRTWREADDATVVEGHEIQVVLDHETKRPTPVPPFLRDAVERVQGPVGT